MALDRLRRANKRWEKEHKRKIVRAKLRRINLRVELADRRQRKYGKSQTLEEN